ncbi:MAG: DSD1 family PLP-dependent enzyme [Clostridiales bacterium]|nr:DSD1 family PLP-dependent enzyme [Clostridiales bacterium]
MKIEQIETPALLLDLDAMESNIRRMQGWADELGIALRPHYKSHKSPWIARRQMEAGAVGITCAKLGEAEDLVNAGFEDVLIANQVVDAAKIHRLARLAVGRRLGVCVDDGENIAALEQAATQAGSELRCLIEYEVGMRRCGVDTKEEFLRLAEKVAECPHLVYDGIQAYAGNLAHMADGAARQAASAEVDARVGELAGYLQAYGLPALTVSGGSTGTAAFKGAPGKGGVYTELQAGSYVFMDGAYGALGLGFRQALYVLSEIVSAKEDYIVADAGLKSFGTDQGPPRLAERGGGGAGIDISNASMGSGVSTGGGAGADADVNMSEEHMRVSLPGHGYRVRDKILFIPGHGCTTVNLYDHIHLYRGDEAAGQIDVVSRGKSR